MEIAQAEAASKTQSASKEGVFLKVPYGQVKQDFNYRRRYRNIESLAEDIKANSLMQPVVLRDLGDGSYQLIAGGRRMKALKIAFGTECMVPAMVKVLTDEEAVAAMMAENIERENPSAIEDAEGAARMLKICRGNREEAANRLRWPRSMLDRRLALMNACANVRDAYLEDKIELGHLEVFAALRVEVQERVLANMLAAPERITVAHLKALADKANCDLGTAIFDKTECSSCKYNSGNQQALFNESFEGSRCTNSECFGTKTNGELQKRADELKDTFQVIKIVRGEDKYAVNFVRETGDFGVGAEQLKACHTCTDYGGCVSARPDTLGKVYKGACFNASCYDEKRKTYVEAEKKARQHQAAQAPAQGQQAKPANASGAAAKGAKAPAPAPAATPKATNAGVRQQIREYRENLWRAIYKSAVAKLGPVQNRSVLLAIALTRPSNLDHTALLAAVNKSLGVEVRTPSGEQGYADLLGQILGFEESKLGAALPLIAAHLSVSASIAEIVGYLRALDVKIEKYWKVEENFLSILTKAEIDAICTEIGVADALGKRYDGLKNGKKDDFIKGVLAVEGFDFRGLVPQMIRWTGTDK